MTDSSKDTNPTQPGNVPIKAGKSSFWDSASIIWLIPILALAIALGAAWRNYNAQGPLIQVSFENAAGIRAGETQMRYRDIRVGTVEELSFSKDLTEVVASIRVEKSLAPYINRDAVFWIVRPEVSARGVSGLDTVLSGVYIQGSWDSEPGIFYNDFEGLKDAPLLSLDREGISFTLRSDDGLPGSGTPILYKGVEVGLVGNSTVNDDGTGVSAVAVIYKPYSSFVTSSTRFWDISGFSFSVGASGAQLNFTSLASLISGGVTFAEIGSGGTPLAEGATFELFSDETAARDDFLVDGDGQAVNVSMIFDQNLAGLAAGSPVELGGLKVGEITGINGIVDRERFGDNEARLIATARINPGRIGLGQDAGEDELLHYLSVRIGEGLRARLTNASIFTGGLKVELVVLPGTGVATLDRGADPLPRIPTANADVTDVGATAQGVLQRVNDLPVEEVMQSITDFLNNATALISSEELQRAPAELTGILTAVRGVAESEGVQGLPEQISTVLSDLQETGTMLNRVISVLEEQDAAGKLTTAIDNVGVVSATLPELVADIRAVLVNAQEVPLAELSQNITELLASADLLLTDADTLITSADVQAIPTDLRGILSSVRDVTTSADVQALPTRVTELLAGLQSTSARLDSMIADLQEQDATGKLTSAIDNVGTATESLPDLLADIRSVVAKAEALPLAQLSQDVSDLLTTAEALIANEDVQAVPVELRQVLSSLREVTTSASVQALPTRVTELLTGLQDSATTFSRLLRDVETQDTVGKLTAAVDDVAQAAEGLPSLVEEARGIVQNANEIPLARLSDQATKLLESANALVDQDSTRALPGELNTALAEVSAVLRELQDGGLINNANATLASARDAADAIAEASATLPQLAADLRAVATQAGTTLSAYSEDSSFTRDTRGAIRQIQSAAEAIERLARTIERNPNSLILGR
ncbi:PqiB family protein [Puniceibacterium sediminis]|uniref:Paraquat-inducible protein B n=1 Tax=Puniceibacterium sediminis TaxID=1608407 RepID=A0A238Z2J9_9RHOB|nr:MlaD family protein [Puniceibacterium sediminis]SNR77064.1 paraquat-inducible protein B [Puniceibacterium sediminis]